MIDDCGSSVRGITLMSLDGGGKGEVEFWIGQQECEKCNNRGYKIIDGQVLSCDCTELYAVKAVGSDVRDLTRKDVIGLRDILNELLDSDLR